VYELLAIPSNSQFKGPQHERATVLALQASCRMADSKRDLLRVTQGGDHLQTWSRSIPREARFRTGGALHGSRPAQAKRVIHIFPSKVAHPLENMYLAALPQRRHPHRRALSHCCGQVFTVQQLLIAQTENSHGKLFSFTSRHISLILAQSQWAAVDDGPGLHVFCTSFPQTSGQSH